MLNTLYWKKKFAMRCCYCMYVGNNNYRKILWSTKDEIFIIQSMTCKSIRVHHHYYIISSSSQVSLSSKKKYTGNRWLFQQLKVYRLENKIILMQKKIPSSFWGMKLKDYWRRWWCWWNWMNKWNENSKYIRLTRKRRRWWKYLKFNDDCGNAMYFLN